MLGTNDARAFNWRAQEPVNGYERDYKEMIESFASLPSAPTVRLMVPPPVSVPAPYEMDPDIINGLYPELIRQIASSTRAETEAVDVFERLGGIGQTRPEFFCDGCHLFEEGNKAIAELVYETITGNNSTLTKAKF